MYNRKKVGRPISRAERHLVAETFLQDDPHLSIDLMWLAPNSLTLSCVYSNNYDCAGLLYFLLLLNCAPK